MHSTTPVFSYQGPACQVLRRARLVGSRIMQMSWTVYKGQSLRQVFARHSAKRLSATMSPALVVRKEAAGVSFAPSGNVPNLDCLYGVRWNWCNTTSGLIFRVGLELCESVTPGCHQQRPRSKSNGSCPRLSYQSAPLGALVFAQGRRGSSVPAQLIRPVLSRHVRGEPPHSRSRRLCIISTTISFAFSRSMFMFIRWTKLAAAGLSCNADLRRWYSGRHTSDFRLRLQRGTPSPLQLSHKARPLAFRPAAAACKLLLHTTCVPGSFVPETQQ